MHYTPPQILMKLICMKVENSVDPDQLASLKPADLDLHSFQNMMHPSLAKYGLTSYKPVKRNLMHFFYHQYLPIIFDSTSLNSAVIIKILNLLFRKCNNCHKQFNTNPMTEMNKLNLAFSVHRVCIRTVLMQCYSIIKG